jgi:hypothetical protein
MNQLSSLQRRRILEEPGERALRACGLASGSAESAGRSLRNEANRVMELSTLGRDRSIGAHDHPVSSTDFREAHEWRQPVAIGNVRRAKGRESSRRARVGRAEASDSREETGRISDRTDDRTKLRSPIRRSFPSPRVSGSNRVTRDSAERTQAFRENLFDGMGLRQSQSCAGGRIQGIGRIWNLVESHHPQSVTKIECSRDPNGLSNQSWGHLTRSAERTQTL